MRLPEALKVITVLLLAVSSASAVVLVAEIRDSSGDTHALDVLNTTQDVVFTFDVYATSDFDMKNLELRVESLNGNSIFRLDKLTWDVAAGWGYYALGFVAPDHLIDYPGGRSSQLIGSLSQGLYVPAGTSRFATLDAVVKAGTPSGAYRLNLNSVLAGDRRHRDVYGTGGLDYVVTVVPVKPTNPVATANPLCGGGTTTLSATVGVGETTAWYDAATGGNLLGTGNLAVAPTSATTYYVAARNIATSRESPSRASIQVTVSQPPTTNLGVSPASITVCSGSTIPVVVANSEVGVTYQLYNGGDPSGSSDVGNGQNLTLTSGPISTDATLTVRATRSPCILTPLENVVAVAVHPSLSITGPDNQNLLANGTAKATFTVAATNGGGVSGYQWQVNTGSEWVDVADGEGGMTASYTTPVVTETMDGYQYRCVVTPVCGVQQASAANELTVAPQALEWYSVKEQGPAGSFAAAMDPTMTGTGGSSPFIEPRRGDLLIRVVFDKIVTAGDGTMGPDKIEIRDSLNNEIAPPVDDVTATMVNDTTFAPLAANGQSRTLEIGVNLPRDPNNAISDYYLYDQKRLTVTLKAGQNMIRRPESEKAILAGDRDCQIRCLIGDVSQGGSVNTSDLSAIRDAMRPWNPDEGYYNGQVTQDSFLFDANSNGTINVVDMALVRNRAGKTVP